MKVITNDIQQQQAVLFLADTFTQYKDLLKPFYNRLLGVYEELSTFKYPKSNEWSTSFKVNKMHEVSNKILPRIISRSPKWIVSTKPDMITNNPTDPWQLEMQAMALQDLLYTIFQKYNLSEATRLWAKGMVNYGVGFAKVTTKYNISRKVEATDDMEEVMWPDWVVQQVPLVKKIKETVADEFVTIEPVSWTDLYYDPRYIMFSDMPWCIHVVDGVRLWQLKANDDYMNVDKIDALCNMSSENQDYKWQIRAITWIQSARTTKLDKNNICVKFYYWLYDLKDNGDERLYKIGVADDLVCICFEEITQIPFEQIRCFEDTETNMSTGFLEPIMGLQQELNYKKNSASNYINISLNRSWLWSANSWVNPKKLISKPNNIIQTTKSVEEAMRNLQEIPYREIHQSYFAEQNDFERQIQGLTFTIDTNNSANANWLTNTATGMRIKFYESNVVIDEVRKHFEEGLERLAYKLLTEIWENASENITIKQIWDDWFWEINQEALLDALNKYEIKVEAGSSSFDTIEERRNDSIAKWNIWAQAKWLWVNANLDSLFTDVLDTFEWTDWAKYVQPMQPMWLPWMPWQPPQWWGIGWWPIPKAVPQSWPAANLTQSIAQWSITTWL
jgi:hypothetical protein